MTLPPSAMNPDKLFDYLDGKLSPADRAALEEKLVSDPHLRQQFNVAREIHRGGGVSREVRMPLADPEAIERSGKLGRRIATAAVVLVFLNVAIGLGVIAFKNNKPAKTAAQQHAIRQPVEDSIRAAGENALPPPSLADDEITLASPKAQWNNLAGAVSAAAQASGGSALQAADPNGVTITASIPQERVLEFRQRIVGTGFAPTGPTSSAPASGATTIVQVRIAEAAR